jgi:hypothetical protein
LIYALGAIQDDPPSSKNAVIAFARQAVELPAASHVTTEVFGAIAATLDEQSGLKQYWVQEIAEATSLGASQDVSPTPCQPPSASIRQTLLRSPRSESGTETATAPSDDGSGVSAFVKWFGERFKEHVGAPYATVQPRDNALAKQLLKTHDRVALERMTDLMLTCADDWIVSTDRSIAILSHKANWLAQRCTPPPTRRRASSCPHDPPCDRRTACIEKTVADGRAERAAAGQPSDDDTITEVECCQATFTT